MCLVRQESVKIKPRGVNNIRAEHDWDVDVIITVEYVHEIYGGPAGGRGGSCVTVAAAAVTSGPGADGGIGRGEKLPAQVWSLTQFYSVDFSKSRIDVKKCVFNKRTIKVCVSCC